MKIRKDIDVEELLKGAVFLGNGCSKEAYEKDGKIIKIPRGRYMIQHGGWGNELHYPTSIDEVDAFLEDVDMFECQMVWPLGQFAIEVIIWEAIKEIEEKYPEVDIDCFAKIEDYFLDVNGIPVIIQEKADNEIDPPNTNFNKEYKKLKERIKNLEVYLDEYNIQLRDVREGNCGFTDRGLRLFDFGISTTTSLDNYGSFSDYDDYCYDDESC